MHCVDHFLVHRVEQSFVKLHGHEVKQHCTSKSLFAQEPRSREEKDAVELYPLGGACHMGI
jgi:hypothetical protein